MDHHNDTHALTESVAYAIWRARTAGRAKRRLDDCRIVAACVVAHLQQSGWRFDHPEVPIGPGRHPGPSVP